MLPAKKLHPAGGGSGNSALRGSAGKPIVFGRESERRNQEVVACVVAKGLTRENYWLNCRARLSSWQVPRRIIFRRSDSSQ